MITAAGGKSWRSGQVHDARAELGLNRPQETTRQPSRQRQEEVLKRQDLIIDDIYTEVKTLGVITSGINRQIIDQEVLLNHTERGMSKASVDMDRIQKRTKDAATRAQGNRPFWIQVCLVITAVVLVVLIVAL